MKHAQLSFKITLRSKIEHYVRKQKEPVSEDDLLLIDFEIPVLQIERIKAMDHNQLHAVSGELTARIQNTKDPKEQAKLVALCAFVHNKFEQRLAEVNASLKAA